MNYFGTAVRAINHAARTNKEKEEIILSRFREIDRFLLFSNEDSPPKKKCSRKKMRDDVIEAWPRKKKTKKNTFWINHHAERKCFCGSELPNVPHAFNLYNPLYAFLQLTITKKRRREKKHGHLTRWWSKKRNRNERFLLLPHVSFLYFAHHQNIHKFIPGFRLSTTFI